MHPDIGIPVADRSREAVDNLVFIREVDADFFVEGDIEVFGERDVARLGNRRGLPFDPGQPLGIHNFEVLRLGHTPGELGVVAAVGRVEALRPGGPGGKNEQEEQQKGAHAAGRGSAHSRDPDVRLLLRQSAGQVPLGQPLCPKKRPGKPRALVPAVFPQVDFASVAAFIDLRQTGAFS